MGTRADFYIGKGKDAKWLGSVSWDGYQWDEDKDCALMKATNDDEFIAAVIGIKEGRKDFTAPESGWPWPWDNSHTTDYAYMLIDGKVKAYCFGGGTFVNGNGEFDVNENDVADFPDMSQVKNVAFGNKSGVIIIGG